MATVRWTGSAITRAQITTLTVGSATVGHTFTLTLNTKAVTYTAIGGDTTATIAAAIYALLAARTEPEFAEITFSYTAAGTTITCTGPDDGTPFTVTLSGTGTYTQSTTSGTPSSPNDASIAANYSGGAVPSNSDTLVFDKDSPSVLWGLTALAGISLTVVREEGYAGSIGLPDENPARYPEYRTTHLSLKAAVTRWVSSPRDSAGQFRLNYVTTAAAIRVSGEPSNVEPGSEALEIKGTPATSTLTVAGGSVAACPVAGQTGTLATVSAVDATVTLGPGLTATTVVLDNSRAVVMCDTTTLRSRAGSRAAVKDAAAGGYIECYGGLVSWESSGAIATGVNGGLGGEFTVAAAPAVSVANSNGFTVNGPFTIRDPYGRLGAGYTISLAESVSLADVTLDMKFGPLTLTVS